MNPISSFGSFSLSSAYLSMSAYKGSNVSGQAIENPSISLRNTHFPASRAVSRKGDFDTSECQTCKNRKYQDGSNDPSVSFKTPTKLSPEKAAYAVRSHESEHVAHARAKAQASEDTEIVSQSVTYRTGVCPECGKTYIAGGNTQTVFKTTKTMEPEAITKGRFIDVMA